MLAIHDRIQICLKFVPEIPGFLWVESALAEIRFPAGVRGSRALQQTVPLLQIPVQIRCGSQVFQSASDANCVRCQRICELRSRAEQREINGKQEHRRPASGSALDSVTAACYLPGGNGGWYLFDCLNGKGKFVLSRAGGALR